MNRSRVVVGGLILVPIFSAIVASSASLARTPLHFFLAFCLAAALCGILWLLLDQIGRSGQDEGHVEGVIGSIGKVVNKWRACLPAAQAPGQAGLTTQQPSRPAWKLWLGVIASLAGVGSFGYAIWSDKMDQPAPAGPATAAKGATGSNPPPKPDVKIQREEVPQIPDPELTRTEWLGVTGEVSSIPTGLKGNVQIHMDRQSYGSFPAKSAKVEPRTAVWWPCVTRSRVVQLAKNQPPEEFDLHAAFLADFRALAECDRIKSDLLAHTQHVPSVGVRLSSDGDEHDDYETKPIWGGEQAQDFELWLAMQVENLGPHHTVGIESYGVDFRWTDLGKGPSVSGSRKIDGGADFEPYRLEIEPEGTWVGDFVIFRLRRHGEEVRFYAGHLEGATIKWNRIGMGRVPLDIFTCESRSLRVFVQDSSMVMTSALAFGIESERLFKPQIDELKARFIERLKSWRSTRSFAHADQPESPLE